jgi:hypothetical protein
MVENEPEILTIATALEFLRKRGIQLSGRMLRKHCKEGNIQAIQTNPTNPRRGEWHIARPVLEAWQPRPRGYPSHKKVRDNNGQNPVEEIEPGYVQGVLFYDE